MEAPRQDESGRPYVKLDWNINHIRLLYNAVSFYLDKRVEHLKPEEGIKEPTEQVLDMQASLNRMLLEFQYLSR